MGHTIPGIDLCRISWAKWTVGRPYIEGILPKGPYLPCVSMAGRALLVGYPRHSLLVNRHVTCIGIMHAYHRFIVNDKVWNRFLIKFQWILNYPFGYKSRGLHDDEVFDRNWAWIVSMSMFVSVICIPYWNIQYILKPKFPPDWSKLHSLIFDPCTIYGQLHSSLQSWIIILHKAYWSRNLGVESDLLRTALYCGVISGHEALMY